MLTPDEARQLCENAGDSVASWNALHIALQTGGLEVKAGMRVASALDSLANSRGLLGLREYRNIDYALVRPEPAFGATLPVEAVIELKFNYAKQVGEIQTRLPEAIMQARAYALDVSAKESYVLYFIAAPARAAIPNHPRDGGWGYWNAAMHPAVESVREAVAQANASLLGEAHRGDPVPLYFALIT